MSSDNRGSRPTQGGWLNRIKTGTSVVFSDRLAAPDPDTPDVRPAGEPVPAPSMTPRLLTLLRRMVPAEPDGEPPWVYAAELGRETGIARGTVAPLLQRLEAHGWADSERDDEQHVRRFRLTGSGVEGARAGIADAPEPESVPEPRRRHASRSESSRVERRPSSAGSVAAAPAGTRGWLMSDLESANPDLAAAIRRKLAEK